MYIYIYRLRIYVRPQISILRCSFWCKAACLRSWMHLYRCAAIVRLAACRAVTRIGALSDRTLSVGNVAFHNEYSLSVKMNPAAHLASLACNTYVFTVHKAFALIGRSSDDSSGVSLYCFAYQTHREQASPVFTNHFDCLSEVATREYCLLCLFFRISWLPMANVLFLVGFMRFALSATLLRFS